jgi:hypothetical protein
VLRGKAEKIIFSLFATKTSGAGGLNFRRTKKAEAVQQKYRWKKECSFLMMTYGNPFFN